MNDTTEKLLVVLATLFGGLGLYQFTKKLASEGSVSGSLPDVPGLLEREKLEPGFARKLLQTINSVPGTNGDRLTALLSEESGFRPHIKNPIGADGLMQWLPAFMGVVGTSPEKLAKMNATQQLDIVRNTLLMWKKGHPAALDDPAMGGWGNSAGEPDSKVIASAEPPFPPLNPSAVYYTANKGYDKEGKGYITIGDVRRNVYGRLDTAKLKPRIGANGKPIQ